VDHLTTRRIALKRETARLQFTVDYKELMNEYNMSYGSVASALGISGVRVRQLINSDPLTMEDMSALVDVLNEAGTVRVVFILPRP